MDGWGAHGGGGGSYRLAAGLASVLVAALAVAGCTNATRGAGPVPPSAPTSPSAPSSSPAQVRGECTAVATAARNLAGQVAALVGGQASRDQVKAAAGQLRSSLDTARAVIKEEYRADVDAARAAVQQLQSALDAQPLNLGVVRAAAGAALDSVGRVLTVCAPATTSGATTSGPGAPTPTS